jgi:uncharacterized protein YggT (Ycf19 family)
MMTQILYLHLVGGALTFYMLLVAVRWFAPYLELDLSTGSRRWVGRATDPLIELARKAMGQTMGPFDWAPIVVMLAIWLIRMVLVGF